jgi:hypothetical protein
LLVVAQVELSLVEAVEQADIEHPQELLVVALLLKHL